MKKPLKITIIILGALIAVGILGIIAVYASYPDPDLYTGRTVPRITVKPDVRSIMAEFQGDPEEVIKDSFSKLYKTYYTSKGVPKGPGQPPPIARYEGFSESEFSSQEELYAKEWKGFAAIPIPDDAETPEDLPQGVHIARLSYGPVAEIVHFGPYEDEFHAIRTLLSYIEAENYEISGLHEEEYILGPGMLFIQPDDYITIIRYQVQPK